jgi:hypothetical protein
MQEDSGAASSAACDRSHQWHHTRNAGSSCTDSYS